MPSIVIENLFGKVLEIQDQNKTILQHFHAHRIDWMQSCGGKGKCTTCKIIVKKGWENLDSLTTPEKRYLIQGHLQSSERLSCQTKIRGDITISAPEEYKLPHVRYSS